MSNFSKWRDRKKVKTAVISQRKRVRLRQGRLAERLGLQQSLISRLESGRRGIEVCEFFELAGAIGFDPHAELRRLFGGGVGTPIVEVRRTVGVPDWPIMRPLSINWEK
jgi:transcriptional regulator with XRE-family HTH domain